MIWRVAALAFGLTLVPSGICTAAEGDRQSVRSKLTTKDPGSATGSMIEMRFADPANPEGKPYAVDKVKIRLARGMRFDHGALPQCTASDAELMARGEAACPSGSQVQSGHIVLDTGTPLEAARLMRFRTATFNSSGGFVSIGESEDLRFRGVVRSRTEGRRVTVDYADAPGFGGPDSESAMKTMLTSGPALAPGGRPFLRTPRICPRSRSWTTRFTFIYHDGERQREKTRSPCRRPASDRDTDDLPRQDLDMRFTTTREGASTGTRVSLVFRNPSDPFGKPIPVRRERFVFPKGTRFVPTVVPACDASDQELILLGEAACPSESRVGGGSAIAISGWPSDPVVLEIDGFEAGSGLAFLTTVQGLGIRFVARSVRDGRTITVDYPKAPGGPPDGETALREVENLFAAHTSGASAYVRTPRACPPSGRWRFIGRFTYADGVTQKARSTQRCDRGQTIRVTPAGALAP